MSYDMLSGGSVCQVPEVPLGSYGKTRHLYGSQGPKKSMARGVGKMLNLCNVLLFPYLLLFWWYIYISQGRLLHFLHICRRLDCGNDSEHDAKHETQVLHQHVFLVKSRWSRWESWEDEKTIFDLVSFCFMLASPFDFSFSSLVMKSLPHNCIRMWPGQSKHFSCPYLRMGHIFFS